MRVAQCQNERAHRFQLGTGATLSEKEANTFLDAHRSEFHDVEGIVSSGYGLCCLADSAAPPLCVAFGLRLCTTPLVELIETVRSIQLRDPSVANSTLRVSVELEGLTGPRCAAGAPDCGPIPYDGERAGSAPSTRRLVQPPDVDGKM